MVHSLNDVARLVITSKIASVAAAGKDEACNHPLQVSNTGSHFMCILLSNWSKPKFCKDDNFADGQLTVKTLKITALKNLWYVLRY